MGTVFQAASMVIAAIVAFATLLTEQRHYFSEIGSGAMAGQQAEARKREAGGKPWRA